MKPFEGARVILWAGEPDELAAIEQTLSGLGCSVQSLSSFERVRRAIESGSIDLVVACLSRCFSGPLELLSWLQRAESSLPVLVVVEAWDKNLYLEALRRGAFDGLGLPLNEKELIRIASRALEAQRLPLAACGGE